MRVCGRFLATFFVLAAVLRPQAAEAQRQFELNAPPAVATSTPFELPLSSAIGSQPSTYLAVLPIRPPAGFTASYVIRNTDANQQATVSATATALDDPTTAGEASVGSVRFTTAPGSDGLAVIEIQHTPQPADPDAPEQWALDIQHTASGAVDYFVVAAHTEAATAVPRLAVVVGGVIPASPQLDFGIPTVGTEVILTAVALNQGTGPLTLDTATIDPNTSGFFSIVADPAGTVIPPNGEHPIEVAYQATTPAPAANVGTLHVTSSTAGVAEVPVGLEGWARLRELALVIDASGSMNRSSGGLRLAGCPPGDPANRDATFADESRIRQVRTALETLQLKLTEYAAGQVSVGVVRFPGDDLSCGSSLSDSRASAESTWSKVDTADASGAPGLATFDPAGTVASAIQQATEYAFNHGTPMRKGLETAADLFGAGSGSASRALVLLSDGAFNVPDETRTQFLNAARPALVDKGIAVYSLAFGQTSSVDPETLSTLSAEIAATLGVASDLVFQHYDPAAAGLEEDLSKFFNNILVDRLSLDIEGDPGIQIAKGTLARHEAFVTAYDDLVTFSLVWTTPAPNLLEFELIAPDGRRVGPRSSEARYSQGRKHRMYAIDVAELEPELLGRWQMEVRYPFESIYEPARARAAYRVMRGPTIERYVWDTVVQSNLNLRLAFDKRAYATGDPIRVEAELHANGVPLTDRLVRLQVARPGESLGNWYAEHDVPLERIEAAAGEAFGESLDEQNPAALKHYYLTQVQNVAVPSLVSLYGEGVLMRDDGMGPDTRAGDGRYTALLQGVTTELGTYTFRVLASGDTPNGRPFRRERTAQKLVGAGEVDPSGLVLTWIDDGVLQAYVEPSDAFGNRIGPGYGGEIVFTSNGRPLGEVEDDLKGGYLQRFDVGTGPAEVKVEVAGFELPSQTLEPPETGATIEISRNLLILLILLLLVLAIALLVALRR